MQSDKDRNEFIVSARKSGFTFREIGKALGISPQRAHQIVKRIERKNPTSGVDGRGDRGKN